jgi:tetratricopeptide (TPR) repeat protein
MKIRRTDSIWILFVLIIGCAGSPSAPEPPRGVAAGNREIQSGTELYRTGCHHRALKHFLSAHRRFSAADHTPGVAMSLNNIGTVYRALGRPETAERFFDEAHHLYDALGDAGQAAQSLANQSAAMIDSNRLEGAAQALNRAASLFPETAAPAFILKNRGILMIRQQRYGQAETLLRSALDRADPANHSLVAGIRSTLGTLMVETGQDQAALEFFQAALDADRRVGFHTGMADDLAALAGAHERLGEPKTAVAIYKRSVKIHALMGNRAGVESVMAALNRIAETEALDIGMTRHFVQTWLEDAVGWHPCRE